MISIKAIANKIDIFVNSCFFPLFLHSQKRYENLVSGTAPVESHLHKNLAEHINSEIVLQTITNVDAAMRWIRSTFLHVRAIKNPGLYGFAPAMAKEEVERKLEGEIPLVGLKDESCIFAGGSRLQPTTEPITFCVQSANCFRNAKIIIRIV